MRKNSTIIRNKKTVNFLIGILAVSVLFFVGCYEFKTINQPDEAFVNSYFDVPIVVHDDGNPDNDWTVPDLQNINIENAVRLQLKLSKKPAFVRNTTLDPAYVEFLIIK